MGHSTYEPTNKSLLINTGTFLYITESTYDKNWQSYAHKHFCSEIFCINSGFGLFQIEGEKIEVRKGDLVLVNSNVQHTEYSHGEGSLSYYVVGIDGLSFVFDERYPSPLLRDHKVFLNIQFIMKEMIDEMKNQATYHDSICGKLSDILIFSLLRQKELSLASPLNKNLSKETLVAKKFIDKHFSTEITLDQLAKVSLLSKYYLSRKFTEEIGVSPMQYLTEKRLQTAETLLSYSNFTVSQIAELVGYSSQSYFSQVYKKHRNASPLEYRIAHQ